MKKVKLRQAGTLAFATSMAFALVPILNGGMIGTVQAANGIRANTEVVQINKMGESVAVEAEEVQLSETSAKMVEGEKKQLIATVLPANASDKTVTWSSNNEQVATVDAEGNVTAVGEGYTTIIVRTENGKFAMFEVNVTKKPVIEETTEEEDVSVEEIYTDVDSVTLVVGKTQEISIEVLPEEATDQRVTYVSTNTKVAKVTDSGVIRAVAPGKANIVVSSVSDGGVEATVTVTVAPSKVSSLTKKNVKKTSAKLVWKKQKSVTGYKVYLYKAGKYKLYQSVKTNSLMVKKLKANTTYRFKIRAYKKVGSKTIYGEYSKVLSVKTKK